MAIPTPIRQLGWQLAPSPFHLPRRALPSLPMSKTRSEVLAESGRKGVIAGVATAGAVAAGLLVAPVAGAVVAVPAAVLAWRWWKHRAENGIKF